MHRVMFAAMGIFLLSTTGFGQRTSTDAQVLQSLLTEVRQLRLDLHNTIVTSQRVQIALYRLQGQEAAVARATQSFDYARSKLDDAQSNRKQTAIAIQQDEELKAHAQDPATLRDMESVLSQHKAKLEKAASETEEWQIRETQAEQQLRTERTRLAELQDLLDRLDKALDK